jgi:hypothetical protein
METMELFFFDGFILLHSNFKRLKTPYIIIKCVGVEDGEKLELYTNGKISGNYTVIGGKITIPITRGNVYRLASPKYPYGVRFNTTDPRDNTDDILVFHTINADSADMKNLYRMVEHLCSIIKKQQQQIKSLTGYQTE